MGIGSAIDGSAPQSQNSETSASGTVVDPEWHIYIYMHAAGPHIRAKPLHNPTCTLHAQSFSRSSSNKKNCLAPKQVLGPSHKPPEVESKNELTSRSQFESVNCHPVHCSRCFTGFVLYPFQHPCDFGLKHVPLTPLRFVLVKYIYIYTYPKRVRKMVFSRVKAQESCLQNRARGLCAFFTCSMTYSSIG